MREYDGPPYIVIERRGEGGAFLLGALVGFGAALLLAPRSGAATRSVFADAALGVLGGPAAGVTERVSAVREAVGARTEQARAALETGRGAARDARSELMRRVEEAKALRRSGRAPGAIDAPAPPEADLVVVSVDTESDPGDLAR